MTLELSNDYHCTRITAKKHKGQIALTVESWSLDGKREQGIMVELGRDSARMLAAWIEVQTARKTKA